MMKLILGRTPDPRLLGKISLTGVFYSREATSQARTKETKNILPTCGTARFSSGMSVLDLMRGYSVITYPESALKSHAGDIIRLAEAEGMNAHALAITTRLAPPAY